MHRILLREVVIDVPTEQFAATRDFWSGVLDATPRQLDGHAEFTSLDDPAALCHVGLQDVGPSAARLHLDIESDDIEAEVARLTQLGAAEVGRHGSWVVLRDPAGLLVCVVPPESDDFELRSRPVG